MADPQPSLEQTCFHCSLPIPPGELVTGKIEGDLQDFCCTGCKAVCQAIYDAGYTVFHCGFAEIQQKAQPHTSKLEIGQELFLVSQYHMLHGL